MRRNLNKTTVYHQHIFQFSILINMPFENLETFFAKLAFFIMIPVFSKRKKNYKFLANKATPLRRKRPFEKAIAFGKDLTIKMSLSAMLLKNCVFFEKSPRFFHEITSCRRFEKEQYFNSFVWHTFYPLMVKVLLVRSGYYRRKRSLTSSIGNSA